MPRQPDPQRLSFGYSKQRARSMRIEVPSGLVLLDRREDGIRVEVSSVGLRYVDEHAWIEELSPLKSAEGGLVLLIKTHPVGSCPGCGGKEESHG